MIPSFSPEYAVSAESKNGKYYLISNTLSQNSWQAEKSAIKINTKSTEISKTLYQALGELLRMTTHQIQDMDGSTTGLDGTTYYFSTTNGKGEVLTGKKWSPDRATLMGRLVQIYESVYAPVSYTHLDVYKRQTLGGRYIPIDVYPYSFKEFLIANNVPVTGNHLLSTEGKAEILRKFNDYFYFGGFPEGAEFSVKRDYLTSVYQKIYLGDIAARHTIDNTFALRIIFKKLAESVKQPLSFTRIANIVSSTGAKVGTQTVINYMEYAKDAWLILSLIHISSY